MSDQEQQTKPDGGASASTAMLGGWRPIETAPHDGTVIELLGENGKLDIGEWHEWSEHFDKTANEIAEGVTGEFSTEYGEGPHTHWRPCSLTQRCRRRAALSPGRLHR